MQPQFYYFDMGNVVLPFSHERMAEQMARVAGVEPQLAWRVLFEKGGLEWAYERGELTREQFYARFCEAVGARADTDKLEAAGSDIFTLNAPLVALVGHMVARGCRLGILSNTTPSHWEHCTRRFGVLTTMFTVHALSYRIGAMKPDAAVYAAAARQCQTPPERIFFTDDRADNVTAARAAGWDAVVYESVSQLNRALRERGLRFNY
jgi:putative hydrolase of the HAD superfamily